MFRTHNPLVVGSNPTGPTEALQSVAWPRFMSQNADSQTVCDALRGISYEF